MRRTTSNLILEQVVIIAHCLIAYSIIIFENFLTGGFKHELQHGLTRRNQPLPSSGKADPTWSWAHNPAKP